MSPVPPCLIYSLADPRTGEIRYIGQSSRGLARARQHLLPSSLRRGAHTYKVHWIKSLLTLGLKPVIGVVEELRGREGLDEAERRWIFVMRLMGFRLVNATEGGGGVRGCKVSLETRAKIAKIHTGMKHSPETRARMSEMKRKENLSPETLAKMSESHLGQKQSPETRVRKAAALRGRKRPPEVVAKIAASNRGKRRTAEERAKLIGSHGNMVIDDQGVVYRSASAAARALGCATSAAVLAPGTGWRAGGHHLAYYTPGETPVFKKTQREEKARAIIDDFGVIYGSTSVTVAALRCGSGDPARAIRGGYRVKGRWLTYYTPGKTPVFNKGQGTSIPVISDLGVVYGSTAAADRELGCSGGDVSHAIKAGRRVKGHRFSYYTPESFPVAPIVIPGLSQIGVHNVY